MQHKILGRPPAVASSIKLSQLIELPNHSIPLANTIGRQAVYLFVKLSDEPSDAIWMHEMVFQAIRNGLFEQGTFDCKEVVARAFVACGGVSACLSW
jgi:hypothetical protein